MSIEVYPVVHVRDSVQAAEQASLAYEAGADGVYLIDHFSVSTEELIRSYVAVDVLHPDKFVGLNLLQIAGGCAALEFIDDLARHGEIRRLPDGLWADDASVMYDEMVKLRGGDPRLQEVKYVGGVAFKGTPAYTDDPELAAEQALSLADGVDVLATSGPKTGQASSVEKVACIKGAIKDRGLALASGVDEHNLASYAPFVSEVLVATSIETDPYSGIFDLAKLERLIATAHHL